MATELLRDKIANLLNRVNSFKLELYLSELQVKCAEDPPKDADDITVAACAQLNNEANSARVSVAVLKRRLSVLQPELDSLTAELTTEAAALA